MVTEVAPIGALAELLLPPFVDNPDPICPWSEANIVVSVSDRPGKLILDPYQRPILEAIADLHMVEQVTMMMSSQLGKTLLMAIALGWIIDQAPQAVLFMHASDQGLKKFLREKLEPVLLGTPRLNEKIVRNNRNTIPKEGFSFGLGGFCTLTTARSKSSKHGTSASYVFADEIDDYEGATKVSSLKQRTITFSQPKLILASTPTLAGQSPIEAEWATGTRSCWYAVCPLCEGPQQLVQHQILHEQLWCVHCKKPWDEQHRVRAIIKGHMLDEVPNPHHKSYWMSQLYSLNVTLEKTLRDTANYSKMEYSTQVLAWPYEEVIIKPLSESQIRREELPFTPSYITIGVDVQINRLEYSILAFDRLLTKKHIVKRDAILRTEDYECFRELRRQVSPFRPRRLTIDGSYDFDWVKKGLEVAFQDLFILQDPPVEIVRGYTASSFDKPLRGGRGHGFFWGAVDEAKVLVNKDLTSGQLTLAPNLPADTEKQLASERLIRYEQGGRVKRKWDPIPGRANEVLDCVCYAYMGVLALDIGVFPSPELVTA